MPALCKHLHAHPVGRSCPRHANHHRGEKGLLEWCHPFALAEAHKYPAPARTYSHLTDSHSPVGGNRFLLRFSVPRPVSTLDAPNRSAQIEPCNLYQRLRTSRASVKT